MKWVRYGVLGIVGLLALGFLLLIAVGGLRGESRQVRSIEIARPASVVFAWITEPQRVRSWMGWMVEIRSLTPPPMTIGSREVWVMEDRNNNNQRMDISVEVVRFETDHLLEARLTAAEGFTGTVTYELQPMDAHRTYLTYRATYQFENWLARLLEPIISRSAQQKLIDDLARLKQQAEAE